MGEQTRDERLAHLRTRQEQRTQRHHPAKHARRIAGSVAGVGFVAMVPMMGPLKAAETEAGAATQPSPTIPPRVVPVASVVTVIPTVLPGTTSLPALLPTLQPTSTTAINVIPKDRVETGINATPITTATSGPDVPTVPEGVTHPPPEQPVVAQPLAAVVTAPPETAPTATTPPETTQPVAAPVSTEPPPPSPPPTLPPPPVTEPPPPPPPPPPTSGASGG